ncbi:hypothetical protein PIB30_016170 [Stylosanthes scabra]|uniref:Uncharacterized protein n=1 Tax=Stylosanthes scabra TaxID=79078 RepID=A0ABU6U6C1_9FABA|nr:hypothetical protein [Stylosanthes scabra]
MYLRGNKINVKEAYYKRDNKTMAISENGSHEVGYASPRNASVKIVKVVNEREDVLANELVMMVREEVTWNESRVLVSHDILDEWSFSSYKENLSMCATERMIYEVLSNSSSDY